MNKDENVISNKKRICDAINYALYKYIGKMHKRYFIPPWFMWLIFFLVLLAFFLAFFRFCIILGTAISSKEPTEKSFLFYIVISILQTIVLFVPLTIGLYQLRHSKRIAEGTFVTELNTLYVRNRDYVKVYDYFQACHDKECKFSNRGKGKKSCDNGCLLPLKKSHISNYLTFFESMYLLYKKGVLDFDTLDDLFAWRFFLAVHSRCMQERKLRPQPENFLNIFYLEKDWLSHRLDRKKTRDGEQSRFTEFPLSDIFVNDYGKDKGKEIYTNFIDTGKFDLNIELKEFEIRRCSPADIDEILQIKREAFGELNDKDILQWLSKERLLPCLDAPYVTLGAWYNKKEGGIITEKVLVAFSVLYYPQDDSENLSLFPDGIDRNEFKTANNELCIVRKNFWGNSLQYKLEREFEKIAKRS